MVLVELPDGSSVSHVATITAISDADLIDWPDLIALVPIAVEDLPEIRRLSNLSSPARERPAAALVMFGSQQDILELALRPEVVFRRTIAGYLGARVDLDALSSFAASEAPDVYGSGTVADSLPRLVARAEQARLKHELETVPVNLRAWRARQIVEARSNAFDAGFQRVLSPGAKAWLERFARSSEGGDGG